VKLSGQNRVQGVTVLDKEGGLTQIDCHQLVLCCGPWAPGTFEAMFPISTIQLQSATDAGDWILFNNPCPTTRASTAFVSFANIAGDKMEFAGRNDDTFWACGQRNFTSVLPPPGCRGTPDDNVIDSLAGYARQWLNWTCECREAHDHNLQLMTKGRGFRPSTKTRLPAISEVPSSQLASNVGPSETHGNGSGSGVFVCWGH
jgi:hypothetical protein